MPEKQTIERVKKAKRSGKSASTQAGEFVREEIHHIREDKHGARSTKQAIAIGLSKARRSGVNLPPPKKGTVSEETRRSAAGSYELGKKGKPRSTRRSRARQQALKREPRSAASKQALSRHARSASRRRKSSGQSSMRSRRRSATGRKQAQGRTRHG